MYFSHVKSGVSYVRGDMAALINEILENLSSSSSFSTLLGGALTFRSKASTTFQAAEQMKR